MPDPSAAGNAELAALGCYPTLMTTLTRELAQQTAKVLADAVIPNEYGIDPGGKLRIGAKICCALLGKLLADLANMREESLATAARGPPSPPPPRGSACAAASARQVVSLCVRALTWPCAAPSLPPAPPAPARRQVFVGPRRYARMRCSRTSLP
jgi:hypothetical protein